MFGSGLNTIRIRMLLTTIGVLVNRTGALISDVFDLAGPENGAIIIMNYFTVFLFVNPEKRTKSESLISVHMDKNALDWILLD